MQVSKTKMGSEKGSKRVYTRDEYVWFFKEADKDKDGFLTLEELAAALKHFAYRGSDWDILVGIDSYFTERKKRWNLSQSSPNASFYNIKNPLKYASIQIKNVGVLSSSCVFVFAIVVHVPGYRS